MSMDLLLQGARAAKEANSSKILSRTTTYVRTNNDGREEVVSDQAGVGALDLLAAAAAALGVAAGAWLLGLRLKVTEPYPEEITAYEQRVTALGLQRQLLETRLSNDEKGRGLGEQRYQDAIARWNALSAPQRSLRAAAGQGPPQRADFTDVALEQRIAAEQLGLQEIKLEEQRNAKTKPKNRYGIGERSEFSPVFGKIG